MAVALAAAAAPAAADDSRFSRTIFFGDSLTDAGFFRPLLPPEAQAVAGQFTTNPGWVWAQFVADHYGTDASANGNGQDGDNYAVGGAWVVGDRTGALGPTPSVTSQVGRYLASTGGSADPDALYTIWAGANDIFAIAAGAPVEETLGTAVTGQIGLVGALQQAGARYILVPTLPDVGITPAARAQGPAAQAQLTALATAYNDALFGGIAGAGLRVIPLDTFSFLQEVVAEPGLYGFANVTGTACEPQIVSQSLTCNPSSYTNPDAPKTYLFADGVHPTDAGHAVMADLALSVLEAPVQIAALPQSAAVVGRARADRVAWHLDGRPQGDGANWWVDLRGDYQRYHDADAYDGLAPALTGGVDWTRGNLVFGAFGGYGVTRQDWGLRRGEFEHSDITLGGFAGWYGDGGGWVNGQLSWTQLDIDSDRDVWLGPALRTHRGSADGENLTVALNGGWEFRHGNLRHGPVLGLVSQQIDIDGFAESDPELSTSLAYPDQTFDSLVGSVGWQLAVAEGHLRPYARLTWDREFEDAPDEVFARSQSIAGSDWYAVPGMVYDDSYATVALGARTTLLGLDAGFGLSTTLSHADSSNSTVHVTFGKGF
ncbi:autotransporter domain-containing protein [Luteimonas sp. RD2P54]|uniref:Autotransporter domain-containing protein n=1 Tax=Luteimonas endophytica TaxID=3042023 RepID=A0ABT6J7N5_9GAMM|nr:autotransporter domain-containing protein [Luteimonas endophytica]MDH5822835.1 autotransporter domain-containing protein [Luteimonas endophytica]